MSAEDDPDIKWCVVWTDKRNGRCEMKHFADGHTAGTYLHWLVIQMQKKQEEQGKVHANLAVALNIIHAHIGKEFSVTALGEEFTVRRETNEEFLYRKIVLDK